jgi:hypothetical protein
MTETEATKLWCPFARVLLPINQSGNRISTFHLEMVRKSGNARDLAHYEQQLADCNCIGSKCMGWRWVDGSTGYCGMAGRP